MLLFAQLPYTGKRVIGHQCHIDLFVFKSNILTRREQTLSSKSNCQCKSCCGFITLQSECSGRASKGAVKTLMLTEAY